MKKLLLLATFIYFILGITTYHPDNKLVMTWASLKNGAVWNIWNVDTMELAGVAQYNYPPLHYYLDKLQYFVSKPIGGAGYYEWLSNQVSNDEVPQELTRYSFAIKFPLMLFSFLAAYLIYSIAKQNKYSERKSLIAAAIWLFNPITLYSIPVMGQNDVMAIVFFLMGFLLLQRKQLLKSSIIFGLSASVKMFPLIWVPFLLMYEKELSYKKRVAILLGSVFTYLITLLPFISNPVFTNNVFHQGIDRFFIARIDLGFNDFILIVPVLLMLVLYGIFKKYQSVDSETKFIHQNSVLLLVNLIFLFLSHFHPQWFLWIVPFYIFWLFNQEKHLIEIFLATLGAVISWLLIIVLFNDAALSIGLLQPFNEYLAVIPSIKEILIMKNFDVALYNNYAHTFLAGLAMIFLIYWLNTNEKISHLYVLKFSMQKKYKLPVFFGSLMLAALILLSLSFVANTIPTPLADNAPKINDFPQLLKSVSKSITAERNNLNRFDFRFSDDDLLNHDDYQIQITDDQGNLVHTQKFNGFNVGYRSEFRMNLPTQEASLGKNYQIEIIPPAFSENPIKIASETYQNPSDFGVQAFYSRPSGVDLIKFILTNSIDASLNILKQNIIIVILAVVALWLAL